MTNDETHRHAYNAAFGELGLPWYWDAATYASLQAHGRDAVRFYLQAEQSHLLRAYEADFLVNAIETAKARRHAAMEADASIAYASRAASSPARLAA